MKICSLFASLILIAASNLLAAEEVTIKLLPNTPVIYNSKVQINAQQQTLSGLKDIGTASLQGTFAGSVNADQKPYHFLIIPKTFNFLAQIGGVTVGYDTDAALKKNNIAQERAFVQMVIDHAFRIPLTTDSTAGDPNDFYLIKLFEDPEHKLGYEKAAVEKGLNEMIQAVDSGINYSIGQKEVIDLKPNGVGDKGQVTRTVTAIGKDKVTLKETIDLSVTSFANGENPEDGAYSAKITGEFEKTIQRSNWLLQNCTGDLIIKLSEMSNADEVKQVLSDGDLVLTIHGETHATPVSVNP